MANERKVQLGVEVDATGAKKGFDQVKQEAQSMAKSVADSGAQAGKAIDGIGNGGSATAQKVDAATKSMIQSIQRTTAAMEAGSRTSSKYFETLAAQRGVDVNVLKPYLAQLDAVAAKQTDAGISAAQMSAALRGLPAQFSDIAASLASGQKPMTVLMQQGGQLKDMFGGIGPAARAMGGYIVGLINPLTVAAAAVGGIAYAAYQGAKEFEAYNRALILTGNAAGTTADKLTGMADRISKASGITKGAAAEVLTEFAASGQVAAAQFENFAATAVKLQQQAGVAVKDTVKQFVELGKDPVAASVKLNETTNYLTKSIYDQIRALAEQGKNAEAANVAQNAYNDALNQRIPKLVDNLGLVERAWKRIVDTMKGAVDAALDVGRKTDPADTVQKALEASYARLEKLRKLGNGKDTLIAIAEEEKRAAALSKEAEALALLGRQKEKDAAADAERARQLAAYNKWQQEQDKYLPRQAQMIRDLERAKNEARAAGISEDSQEFKARIEGIKREYSDLLNVGLEALRSQQAVQREMLAGELASLESQHKQMLIGDEQYLVRKQELQLKGLEMDRELAQKGADIAGGKKDLAERQRYLGELKKLEAQRKNIIKSTQDEISGVVLAKNKTLVEQADKWRAATVNDRALMEEEIALFGKSADAQKIAAEQMKVDAEARQFLADMQKKGQSLSVRQIDNLLAEADARKINIGTIMGERQARAGAEQLRQENLKFAAESIADEQARAAALLKIDADIWRERIALAGEGTEAQKKLQEQFDQWYANRQMAPVLDRWKTIIGNLDNDFREGFRDMLSHGQDAWKSFSKAIGNTLKTSLADALYQTFVKKYVVQIVASLAGAISGPAVASALGGSGAAADGGGLGGAMGLYSAGKALWEGFSGGFAGLQSTITGWAQSGINLFGVNTGSYAGIGAPGPSALAQGIGTAGAYVGGALLGHTIGNAISDGFETSIVGGQAAVNIGTAIGAAVGGPIGAVVGGALGGVFNRAFGMGPKETQRRGIEGDFGSTGFTGRNFADWHQDGGWFRGDDNGTDYSSLDSTTVKTFSLGVDALKKRTADLAQSLGLSASSIEGYSKHIRLELTNDAQKNQQIITDLFTSIGEELTGKVGNFSGFAKEGETASQTMERLSVSLTTANSWLSMLRQRLFQVSMAGGDAASKLADAFGGLQNLTSASAAFYQTYYTEGERAQRSAEDMAKALAAVNLSMPKTKDELRNMAQSLDLNTESGRKAYAVLLSIAPEFANVADYTARAAKEAAANLVAAFSGGGQLVPVLNATQSGIAGFSNAAAGMGPVLQAASSGMKALGVDMGATSTVVGYISRLFLDAQSGLIAFNLAGGATAPIMTEAQRAAIALNQQMDTLRYNAHNTSIDMAGLSKALAGVNTETFVQTVALVFENLGNRIKEVIGNIADERGAVREAALQIINPTVMSKAAIQAGIAGINTKLPSNAGVTAALGKLDAANREQAALDARKASVVGTYAPLVDSNKALYEKSRADAQSSLNYFQSLLSTYQKGGGYYTVGENFDAGVKFSAHDYYTSGGQTAQNNAAYAAYAKAFDTARSALANYTQYSATYNAKMAEIAAQQAAIAQKVDAATAQAKQAQLAYAAALQDFTIDASKSVSKLTRLREETVKYYEAQKQLADMMTNSAAGLRKTVADYRYSQMTPQQQFEQLQTQFSTAYAMALSTDGETLAGYGDKLNSLLNPLLEKAREVLGSDSAYNTFASTVIARAEGIAARLESLTPTNYAADSLAMLAQIDSTLAALDSSARSADKLIVDAINASRDQTVGGLRAVVAALTGQPIPAFALGGFHVGGWRIVGENGPEIEATGPARYFSASQTRAIFSGAANDELVAEMRALRRENADMRAELRAIASYTGKTARQMERFDQDGLLVRTDADSPLHMEAV